MDKTSLEKFKKDYNKKKELIDEIVKLRTELDQKIDKLLDSGVDASLYEAVKAKNDDDIIIELYKNTLPKLRESDTEGIYVYLGTYEYIHYDVDGGFLTVEQVDRDDKKADFRVYQNIEQKSSLTLAISSAVTFEENHTIIYPINTKDNTALNNIIIKYVDGITNNKHDEIVDELKMSAEKSKEYVKSR